MQTLSDSTGNSGSDGYGWKQGRVAERMKWQSRGQKQKWAQSAAHEWCREKGGEGEQVRKFQNGTVWDQIWFGARNSCGFIATEFIWGKISATVLGASKSPVQFEWNSVECLEVSHEARWLDRSLFNKRSCRVWSLCVCQCAAACRRVIKWGWRSTSWKIKRVPKWYIWLRSSRVE